MRFGRNQILLLVAFAGAVLANIVPMLMSFDELDILRDNMRRITDTTRVSRQARHVADVIPQAVQDYAIATAGMERTDGGAVAARAARNVDNLVQSMRRLQADVGDWITPEQRQTLSMTTARLARTWRQLSTRAADATAADDVAMLRALIADSEASLAVLRDLDSKTSRNAEALSKLVYEHLAVTAALLIGAIAIGFSVSSFGSLSIFRALNREQEVNEALEQAKDHLRERSERLSEAQRLGKLGDWRILLPSGEVRLGAETYELLRLDPEQFIPSPDTTAALFAGDSYERAQRTQAEVLKSGAAKSIDIKMHRGDGSIGDFTLTCKPLGGNGSRITGLFGTLQDISERKAAEEQLEAIAYYDPLTGLANRALFSRELDNTLHNTRQHGTACSLLLLDLDRFKEVNDTLGHSAGDELLTRVGHIISRTLGPHSFLARLGGDEFAIIMRGASDEAALARVAGEIVQHLSGSLMLDQGEVSIGTSIGIVMAPRDGRNPGDLLRNADLALYKAKEDGRGRFSFFTPDLDTVVQNKTALAKEMRRAINTNTGLYVHYQPQYELASGRVTGFEALMRWRHPTRGEVSPAEFIPIAESSSLICDLGSWILRQSALQGKRWLDAGHTPRMVSVNVSPAQIWHSDFVKDVAAILTETELPAHLLCLELTESLMADHGEGRVRNALKALKRLGVTLALDDFGTDYSSLGYLAQLPFDKLKIDRVFIHGIAHSHRSRELLKGIVALGRGLGMEVVAEGAETQEEVEILRGLRCDLVQGFAFGTALPAAEAMIFADAYETAALRALAPPREASTDAMVEQLRAAVA